MKMLSKIIMLIASKNKRMSFLVFSLLYTAFTYGQTTLPPGVFTSGSQQTPLVVNANTLKYGAYAYKVSSGVPQKNADSLTNNNLSTLRLFELWPDGSAKELGPAHSPHFNIGAFGGGRFSHWHDTTDNSYSIYFSASDATDPRSNGRSYLAVQPAAVATGDTIGSIYNGPARVWQYYLGTSAPQHRTVLISNPSSYAYAFSVTFNQNGFLQSGAELKAEIQRGIPSFINEPIERKVWRFVRDNRIHELPYTNLLWYHHPLLMFNSAGWGLCDDAASVLKHTAALFGVSTRVWQLQSPIVGGHIVPEVYTNGRWHLYDPDYQTYFINSKLTYNVASVNELASNTSLITSPLQSAPWTPVTSSLVGTGQSATNYASFYKKAYVEPYYNLLSVVAIPLIFNIPPRGSVEIGAHGSSDAPTIFYNAGDPHYQTKYSSVKVSLPQGSAGTLQVFLIPYMIKGMGTVSLYFEDGSMETISITSGTNWNIYDHYYRKDYIKKISYTAGNGGMVIYYLANPIRSSVRSFNSIVLKPSSTVTTGVANPLSVRLLLR
jgi:hypothetical protein